MELDRTTKIITRTRKKAPQGKFGNWKVHSGLVLNCKNYEMEKVWGIKGSYSVKFTESKIITAIKQGTKRYFEKLTVGRK